MGNVGIGEGYFDKPETKKRLWRLLWGFCALTVFLELFIHREHHFPQEDFFGFYAVLGFLACMACILVAKGLGVFLKVRTDYYDDES